MKPTTQLKSSATQNETQNTIEIFCNKKVKPKTQLKSSTTKMGSVKAKLNLDCNKFEPKLFFLKKIWGKFKQRTWDQWIKLLPRVELE